jgi:UDP-glucose 4-epimerase
VRDYIHVVDLAAGHVAALKKLSEKCGCKVGYIAQKGLIVISNAFHHRALHHWSDLKSF